MADSTQPNLDALASDTLNIFSTVLNGIGNAVTMATLPTLFMSEATRTRNKTVLLSGAGIAVVLGAIWGWKEAQEVHRYRKAVTREIESLRGAVDQLSAEKDAWQKRETTARATQSAPEASR